MPVDDHAFHPGGGVRRDELLFVGRLDAQKGADVALRALAELRGPAAALPLRVVGAGPALAGLRRLADELGDRFSPHLAAVLGMDWTAEQLTAAVVRRKAVYNAAWRFFRSYDLLLTPTLAVPPFEHGLQGPATIEGREVDAFYWLSFTFPFNFTGQPAATVPAGFTEDGLPIGLQIVGRRRDDALVLRASAAFETAAPWRDRWPPILTESGL
jgi:aspartyl-tRNA(Asn)/glutamyl-tRNA(Gln) amidotransferase subunit A